MTEEMIPVSGCIVSYNSGSEILDCLRSLRECTKGVTLTLFVSDNGSTDGTPARVRGAFPDVTVLEGENVGFGSGHNRVLPLLSSRYHVIINPDIQLKEDAVSALVAYMEAHPEVGLCGPDVLNPDGTRQELPKRRPNWWYLLAGRLFPAVRGRYCRTAEKLSAPTEEGFCSGCFMLIRTELFKRLGGFDERYFLYMEDADLTRQVEREAKVMFQPGVKVYHFWHRESGRSLKGLKMHLHSACIFFRKWRKEDRKARKEARA